MQELLDASRWLLKEQADLLAAIKSKKAAEPPSAPTAMNRSIDFFERQFRGQAERAEYALNPFERAILPHLAGEVLDLGCGLGNLSLAAAQAGCTVTALDASPSGVEDLARRAASDGVLVDARVEDLRQFAASRQYDCE
jgi:tellurite methyltransferase